MKKQIIIWISIGVIILIVLFYFNDLKNVFIKSGPGEYDSFAQCLTDNGAKMYGTNWCSHCKNQKKLFGKSFKFIDYIDCDYNKKICNNEGIRGYPTWKINRESYPGEQRLERLAQLTGCEM